MLNEPDPDADLMLRVKRGDRVLLMLGNVLPLWEVMLAAMKLGAVIIPATTLLTPTDLADRFDQETKRFSFEFDADRHRDLPLLACAKIEPDAQVDRGDDAAT